MQVAEVDYDLIEITNCPEENPNECLPVSLKRKNVQRSNDGWLQLDRKMDIELYR